MPDLLPIHLVAIILGVFLVARFVKELFMLRDPSGEPMVPPKPPPWDPIWRARRRLWLAVGFTFVLGPLGLVLGGRVDPPIDGWVPLLWLPTLAVLLIRLGGFMCPRCGRNFSEVQRRFFLGYHNAFTRHCLHCGLKAGAPGP